MTLRIPFSSGAASGRHRSKYSRATLLLSSLVVLGLAGCGGSSGASPKATPVRTQIPAGAIHAAKALLDPALYVGASSSAKNACAHSEPPYLTLDCPITARLRRAIFRNYAYQREFHGGYDPVCRCQGPPLTTRYVVPVISPRFAQVVAIRKYYAGYSHLTFIVLHTASGWKTDDIYCTGQIRGSIDNTPVLTACPLQRS